MDNSNFSSINDFYKDIDNNSFSSLSSISSSVYL